MVWYFTQYCVTISGNNEIVRLNCVPCAMPPRGESQYCSSNWHHERKEKKLHESSFTLLCTQIWLQILANDGFFFLIIISCIDRANVHICDWWCQLTRNLLKLICVWWINSIYVELFLSNYGQLSPLSARLWRAVLNILDYFPFKIGFSLSLYTRGQILTSFN